MYESATDGELIARAHSDRGAFSALFARHSKAVYLFAWGVTRDELDAQDITQETFVTAWGKLAEIRIVEASALPWLLVTTRNLLRNHSRKQRTTLQLDESLATGGETNAAARREELQWVMHSISQLGGIDQRICQLCLIEGYGYADAARQLGLTTSAVAKRVERVRAVLRAAVWGES
jgi:RNA polymerase sigma-70 factor (ECF subfamily)